jgi:hypothetical protein
MTSPSRPAPAGAWLIRCYPGWWRDRYADEVLALLEDRPAGWRDRVDLVHGALDAHLRGEGRRSRVLVTPALLAGGAWTIVGAAGLGQAVPLDWPGYAVETLPLATLGALAMTIAQLGLARRAWPASTAALGALLAVLALAGLAWVVALALASVGGPYGAGTAAVQTLVGVAGAALGLAVLRVGASSEGLVLMMTAVALLIPAPAVWLALGTGWTAVGIAAALPPRTHAPPFGEAG